MADKTPGSVCIEKQKRPPGRAPPGGRLNVWCAVDCAGGGPGDYGNPSSISVPHGTVLLPSGIPTRDYSRGRHEVLPLFLVSAPCQGKTAFGNWERLAAGREEVSLPERLIWVSEQAEFGHAGIDDLVISFALAQLSQGKGWGRSGRAGSG